VHSIELQEIRGFQKKSFTITLCVKEKLKTFSADKLKNLNLQNNLSY
jgi:hypothetical protein